GVRLEHGEEIAAACRELAERDRRGELVELLTEPHDLAVLDGPPVEVRGVGGAAGGVAAQGREQRAILAVVVYVEELAIQPHVVAEARWHLTALGERDEAMEVAGQGAMAQLKAERVAVVDGLHADGLPPSIVELCEVLYLRLSFRNVGL